MFSIKPHFSSGLFNLLQDYKKEVYGKNHNWVKLKKERDPSLPTCISWCLETETADQQLRSTGSTI